MCALQCFWECVCLCVAVGFVFKTFFCGCVFKEH